MTVPGLKLDMPCKKRLENLTIPCQQQPVSAGVGSLAITTVPPGASIFIDGVEQIGITTPATITDISSGYHDIILRLQGYNDYTTTSAIYNGQTTPLDVVLIPSEGCIQFNSVPSGAKIYIDDILQTNLTPTLICNLSLGSHTYRITLTGYNDAVGSVYLVAGRGETIFVTLQHLVVTAGLGLGQAILLGGIALGALYLLYRRKCKCECPVTYPEKTEMPTAEYVKDIGELEASER